MRVTLSKKRSVLPGSRLRYTVLVEHRAVRIHDLEG